MTNLPGLNFQLGEDIDALRDAVREFAQAEIAPRAAEIDKSDQFPMDLWQKFGELGVMGITVGEEYGGVVSSATSFGIFVTLDAMYVEGLVHITELGGEYFKFDEARQELRGERSGIRYAIGTRVRVQVSRVDLDGRRIDFRLVNEGEEQGARPARDKGGSRTAPGSATATAGKRRAAPDDEAPRRSTERASDGRRKGTGNSTQKAVLLTKTQEPGKASKGKGRSSRRS